MSDRRRFQESTKKLVFFQQTFFPAGNYTWVVPDGCKSVDVFLVGGGGAAQHMINVCKAGASGGFTKTFKSSTDGWRDGDAISVTPGQEIPIIVGAGGINGDGHYSQFLNSNYRANGGGGAFCTDPYNVNSFIVNPGGSGGGGAYNGVFGTGGSDGADGEQSYNSGKGQGHTTRTFGEANRQLNAGGGGGEDQLGGLGGNTGAGSSNGKGLGGGGYGGGAGAGGDDGDDFFDNWEPGGDGVVMIRGYKYAVMAPGNGIIEYTESGIYEIPSSARTADLFIVGGGGGGAGDGGTYRNSGGGGNGGVVRTVRGVVLSGTTIEITIGKGGNGGTHSGYNDFYSSAESGGATYVMISGIMYAASGGSKGLALYDWYYNSDGNNSYRGTGQYGAIDVNPAVNGIPCPFYDNGYMYGAGGGCGNFPKDGIENTITAINGAETGGGSGGHAVGGTTYEESAGKDATFYGSGGGGAAFQGMHEYGGGKGYQGIVIIKYY